MGALENKVPPPAVFAVFAVLMWLWAKSSMVLPLPGTFFTVVALAIALLSVVLAVSAVVTFRRVGTTISPIAIQQASTLVTSGVFAVTRNPMYVSLAGLLLAWAIYQLAPWTLLGPVLFGLFVTRFQILPEERALLSKFGAPYEAYLGRVRRWL